MYTLVTGGGKIGANVTRSLLAMGHEVTLVEQSRERFARLESEFGPVVILGDATEIHVLERAGIARPPDQVLAVTGDDEDNLIVSQIAREGYGIQRVIARVNDPRNQDHFDLLGITQTISATASILGLVEHEMPEHGLVRLFDFRREGLELVEVPIDAGAACRGKRVASLSLPEGVRLIAVMRQGRAEVASDTTVIRPGDQVLAILAPGNEDALRRVLLGP
jgi:trk system potassium uptake protein